MYNQLMLAKPMYQVSMFGLIGHLFDMLLMKILMMTYQMMIQ